MSFDKHNKLQNNRFRRAIRPAFAILLMLQFSGCYQTENNDKQDILLNRGLVSEPESLSRLRFRSNQAASVLRDIGEGLVRYNASGELVGGVATNWEISDNGLLYSFSLRDDAKWSNGDPVVAADFVSAFQELVTPETGSANADNARHIKNAIGIIEGRLKPSQLAVIAQTETRLDIRLRTPTPFFIQLLAHPSMFPMHRNSRNPEKSHSGNTQRVSNGAYEVSKWVVGATINLQRNSYYWDNANTYFDNVVYHIVQETAELVRYRAGDLHVTENVPSTSFAMVRTEHEDELRIAPYQGIYFYGFNLTSKTFSNNPSIRKALSLAIDRELLVSKLLDRGEQAAYGWVPPSYKNYESRSIDESHMTQAEREEIAIRLYEKSGFDSDNPLRFELRYNTSGAHERIAVAIQSMWHDVLGADVKLVNEELRVLIANINSRSGTEVFRLSWTGDYNDPQAFLKIFESSNPSNFTGYSNTEYDKLMDRASSETDASTRSQLLAQAEKLVLSDHAIIPMYFYVSKHLVNKDIQGWEENILDIHPSQYLTR